MCLIIVLCLTNVSFAQHTKFKTITIINGDKTIRENNINEKEFRDMGKEIAIEINDDSIQGKKDAKKIVINSDDNKNNAFAYAFNNDAEMEVNNDTHGNITKIIIKNDGDKSDSKIEKKPYIN